MSGTVFLGQTELRIEEAEGIATIEIRRAGSLAGDVTVTYGITPISSTEGEDFSLSSTAVVIPGGAAGVTVPITILDDGLGEATEAFTFALVSAEGGSLSAPRTARISILDDETPAPPPPEEPPLVSDHEIGLDFVVGNLDQAVRFVFNPADPNQILIAEKGGIVRVANIQTGESSVFLDISDRVNAGHDRGLLGIELHPDFANNPYVYLFYAVDPPETEGREGNAGPDGVGNRYSVLERFTADAATDYETPVAGSGTILLGGGARGLIDVSGNGELDFTDPGNEDLPPTDRYMDPDDPDPPELVGGFKPDVMKADSQSHMGGALRFGPDGALYVSVGDAVSFNYIDPRAPDVQLLDSLSGKILRIDPLTGDGLADNPFVTPGLDLDSNRAKVVQYGLRNPFSMAVDEDGRVVITDVGQGGWEEINTGGPGANFGWPFYEGVDGGALGETPGYDDLPQAADVYEAVQDGDIIVTAPYRAFSHAGEDPGFRLQSIVSGSVIYDGGRYPAEFEGDFFFSDFLNGNLFAIDMGASEELRYLGEVPGLIHLEQGPDGFLYAANIYNGTIARLSITPIAAPVQEVMAIGDAETEGGSAGDYLLTPAATFAIGGAVGTTRIDLRQDARFVFELNFGDVDAEGADGAAFMLHNNPAGRTALGEAGEFLGVGGLANAVAIEFDTFDNGDADPEADHASIFATDDPDLTGNNGAVELGNVEDGAWHRVEVVWDAASSTLSYRFDGVLRDSRTGAIAPALGDSPHAYFAFTAATGGFLTEHRLRLIAADVTYEDVVAEQAPVIFGGASRLLEVEEGTSGQVLEPEATDAEGGPITWSISGGPDVARFSVDAATGALSFRAVPDFEAPVDSDRDNLYRLTLRAADAGGLTASQTVEIRVTDWTTEGRTGSPGPDRLIGTSGADALTGGGGADTIYGEAGADTILATVDDGNDMIYGGVGPGDTYSLAGTTANAVASIGTPRSSSADTGADTLNGIENLTGGGGSDRLSGNNNGNQLRGGEGADTLLGSAGADALAGDGSADRLDGGTGNDRLEGGIGNDTYLIREAGDLVLEEAGAGIDLVISARPYSLTAEVEWLELTGTVRDGNGNALANQIRGQDAANRLLGREGADTLIGNGGADTLNGGAGGDRIEGGSGSDVIFFATASQAGDWLPDYAGTQDAIHVSAAGFRGGLVAGMDLVAERRITTRMDGLATAPEGTGQFVFEWDTRMLRWDVDGRGEAAAVLVADLSTGRGWTNSEIVVVA